MADLHPFTYGWLIPAFASALAVLGALVGLGCAARARSAGRWPRRGVLLLICAWAVGVGGRLGPAAGAALLAAGVGCAQSLGRAALGVRLHPVRVDPTGLSVNLFLAPVVVFAATVVVALMSLCSPVRGRGWWPATG